MCLPTGASSIATFSLTSSPPAIASIPDEGTVVRCAARHLGAFEEALWATVSGLGDRDTTCAIVGGILALHGNAEIPQAWLEAREPLERMARTQLGERFHRQEKGA